MFNLPLRRASLFVSLLSCAAAAQVVSIPSGTDRFGNMTSLDQIQTSQLQFNLFLVDSRNPKIWIAPLSLKGRPISPTPHASDKRGTS